MDMSRSSARGAGLRHDPALDSTLDSERFRFGANWARFLERLDPARITAAEQSLCELLDADTLDGSRFLDAGSGSGLFSLAARRLGARVWSFDFDPDSVECTRRIKAAHAESDDMWCIQRGSILDDQFLSGLGVFDVVYAWGVLHHTGDLWRAFDNVCRLVTPGGKLCVAIYNDQGLASRAWRVVKKVYNRLPPPWRFTVLWPAFVRLWGPTILKDTFRGSPLRSWKTYRSVRGMSPVIDVKDWVGGYPFEVATPQQVTSFCAARGFTPAATVLRDGIGCNEFVFVRHV